MTKIKPNEEYEKIFLGLTDEQCDEFLESTEDLHALVRSIYNKGKKDGLEALKSAIKSRELALQSNPVAENYRQGIKQAYETVVSLTIFLGN